MKYKKVVLLPGDGIGPEVTREAVKVLIATGEKFRVRFAFTEELVGGASLDATGEPVTDTVISLAYNADAVFLGAVGGPQWDRVNKEKRPETGLLRLRKELGLYTNLRPVRVYLSLVHSSTLKPELIKNIDILVVRELTGGIYFGHPKGVEMRDGEECGIDTMTYKVSEVDRIARVAFDAARQRKNKVISVDKANVLAASQIWRRTVDYVARDYPDVNLEHMLVDNCAMQLIRNPVQFDVLLTDNMFGDILSDEAAMLSGSIGMLPSASLGRGTAMYEPVHGSAPDIAGQDVANPLAAILSVALMCRYSFGMNHAACLIENAVEAVLEKGFRTRDIHAPGTQLAGTCEMGDRIVEVMEQLTCEE
ncbi:MAG TPA: 3-isopropylmalate dehydrogenase [bacterium]|nr:3-isopropylmalate dehydrogenase [bacterium]